MKAITQKQLLALLSEVRGATFATLLTRTDARLKKTGNPLGPVSKVSRVNVTLGFQYDNAVNRQRTREGNVADFESAPRQWGEKVSPMLVQHKGKLYLETKVEKSLDHTFQDQNGKELPHAVVAPFLPARRKSNRQKTEKEILVRDYALDSIAGITIRGENFVVLDS
jgi:hypothetical protein